MPLLGCLVLDNLGASERQRWQISRRKQLRSSLGRLKSQSLEVVWSLRFPFERILVSNLEGIGSERVCGASRRTPVRRLPGGILAQQTGKNGSERVCGASRRTPVRRLPGGIMAEQAGKSGSELLHSAGMLITGQACAQCWDDARERVCLSLARHVCSAGMTHVSACAYHWPSMCAALG